MSNPYFHFKQFTVQQQNCAMKVCTDACLFGAWVGAAINNEQLIINNALDIGTGTGLLSLMLAQKTNAVIDAVEIDELAATQAQLNFQDSQWIERLNIYNSPIQDFNASASQQYDLIISNPPFFENDLKSSNNKRNLALHDDALMLDELIIIAKKLLKQPGIFAVLLPYQRMEYFMKLAVNEGLYILKQALVKQTQVHDYFRCMLLLKPHTCELITEEIIIQNEMRKYTAAFISLLKDYYLNL